MPRRPSPLVLASVFVVLFAGLATAGAGTGAPQAKPPAASQAAAGAPTTAGLPPLIDRDQFFGDPEIAGAQISPDGRYIAFLKPFKGTRNIWVKRTEDAFDKAHPVT